MHGVILWKNKAATKLIIWCDDHGELAILEGALTCSHSQAAFVEGDLIEFDLVANSAYRRAWNARKVETAASNPLAEQLKQRTPSAASPFRGIKIAPAPITA